MVDINPAKSSLLLCDIVVDHATKLWEWEWYTYALWKTEMKDYSLFLYLFFHILE